MAVTKQEFISEFVAEHRKAIINNMDRIAEIAKNASDEKYNRLFDAIAELSYSGASKSLQAAIDDIVDDHLEAQAEREWGGMAMSDIDLQQLMSRRRAAMTPVQKSRSMKRNAWLAKDTASRTLFASVYGLDGGVTPFTLSGRRSIINFDRAMAVGETPLKWVITCYAICRDQQGRDYLPAPMTIELSEPVKQDAINKALSQAHYDWVKECVNKSHLMTLAWIATTAREPSEETAMRIFTELGAWSEFGIVQQLDDGGYLTVRCNNDQNA